MFSKKNRGDKKNRLIGRATKIFVALVLSMFVTEITSILMPTPIPIPNELDGWFSSIQSVIKVSVRIFGVLYIIWQIKKITELLSFQREPICQKKSGDDQDLIK